MKGRGRQKNTRHQNEPQPKRANKGPAPPPESEVDLQPRQSYYDILGLPSDADNVTIKATYRKLALRWHPDKNADDLPQAEKMV